jgi:hypothetical protein
MLSELLSLGETTAPDAARSDFAVLVTLGWNNPGFTLEVDFGPFGTNHLARPQSRQQCDFKGSRGDALWLSTARWIFLASVVVP